MFKSMLLGYYSINKKLILHFQIIINIAQLFRLLDLLCVILIVLEMVLLKMISRISTILFDKSHSNWFLFEGLSFDFLQKRFFPKKMSFLLSF